MTAYKQAVQIVKLVNNSPFGREPTPTLSSLPVSPSPLNRIQSGAPSTAHASVLSQISSDSSIGSTQAPAPPPSVQHTLPPHRDYAFPSLVLITNLFSLSSRHFPSALMLLLSIAASFFSPFLDRYLRQSPCFNSYPIFTHADFSHICFISIYSRRHTLPVSWQSRNARSFQMDIPRKHHLIRLLKSSSY